MNEDQREKYKYTNLRLCIWRISYYGSIEYDQKPDQDHVVYVEAEKCEEAIAMVREYHDDHAVINSTRRIEVITHKPEKPKS